MSRQHNIAPIVPLKELNLTNRFLFDVVMEDPQTQQDAKAQSDRIRRIHERVCRVRSSEKIGVKYMQAWEERYYDMQDAKAEGITEGRSEVIRALIEMCAEIGLSRKDTEDKIKEKLQIEDAAALDYLDLYWPKQP